FSPTAAQYNQLMTLLQTQQALQDIEPEICAGEVFSSCYSNQMAEVSSWIVDSGATTHITNSFKFLENAKPLTNHFVALPDHTKIRALAIGNVILNSSLILYNVIFIPSFRVNLISVSSLLKLSNCTVLFSDLAFIIQDRTSKKVIGRGDETDDLFLLQSPFTVHTRSSVQSCRSVTNVDSTIWHARLVPLAALTSPPSAQPPSQPFVDMLVTEPTLQHQSNIPNSSINLRKSSRQHRPPPYLKDYQCNI
ncbi:hypothetical protein S83_036558, partial [Arachis hypogaea]